jgi:cyanophycinase
MWRSQGVASVDVLHTNDREQADDADFVRPLKEATGVWIGGGDQSRLTASYNGTAVLREIKKVLSRGGVVGGTSAGASVASSLMITGGITKAELGEGFGLVPNIVIDQHFTNRNRMGRLQGILGDHPDMVGVGIDEQTAVCLQGTSLSVVGNASVFVCLPPTETLASGVQRLKPGDKLDLVGLGTTMIARSRSKPDPAALTSFTMQSMGGTPASTSDR